MEAPEEVTVIRTIVLAEAKDDFTVEQIIVGVGELGDLYPFSHIRRSVTWLRS